MTFTWYLTFFTKFYDFSSLKKIHDFSRSWEHSLHCLWQHINMTETVLHDTDSPPFTLGSESSLESSSLEASYLSLLGTFPALVSSGWGRQISGMSFQRCESVRNVSNCHRSLARDRNRAIWRWNIEWRGQRLRRETITTMGACTM